MKFVKLLASIVALGLPLSGCFYEIASNFGLEYPITKSGKVDMSLAPEDDLLTFGLKGYTPYKGRTVGVALFCMRSNGGIGLVAYDSATVIGGFYEVSWPFASRARSAVCEVTARDDGTYTVRLAAQVGPAFVPILSRRNVRCIDEKVQIERDDYVTAGKECLAADGRNSTSPLGINTTVHEINILTLKVSSSFYELYLRPEESEWP
jgi:hypothetical protein